MLLFFSKQTNVQLFFPVSGDCKKGYMVLVLGLLKMKPFAFFLLLTVLMQPVTRAQGLAINTDGSVSDASALLDVKSTAKGILVPRMTTAQMNAIATPANGLMVYNNTTLTYWVYNTATGWQPINSNPQTGFRALLVGPASLASNTTVELSNFTEAFDDGNNFNIVSGQFVVPSTGVYLIDAQLAFSTNIIVTDMIYSMRMYVNGLPAGNSTSGIFSTNPNIVTCLKYTQIVRLTASDRITMAVRQNSGQTLDMVTWPSASVTYFSMVKLY